MEYNFLSSSFFIKSVPFFVKYYKSAMVKCQVNVEEKDGKYYLNIEVPTLDIWNMIYIAED